MCSREPVGSCIIVLRLAAVHDGLRLLSAGLDRPFGTLFDGYIHHLRDDGMAGVEPKSDNRVIDQSLVEEYVYFSLRLIALSRTDVLQQRCFPRGPLLSG